MTFYGINPCTLHPGISIAKEIPPGTVTSQLETLGGSTGELIAGRTIQQGEYIVRINIAGKYVRQAWEIRAIIAAWARPMDEVTARLIPTHWPGVFYDAICKEISPPEFKKGFATVEVVFTLPRAVAISLNENTADSGEATTEQEITVGGSSYARPVITANMLDGEDSVFVYVDGQVCFGIQGEFTSENVLTIQADPPAAYLSIPNYGQLDVMDKVMYTMTDFQRLAKALTPGKHTIRVLSCNGFVVTWRDEWV